MKKSTKRPLKVVEKADVKADVKAIEYEMCSICYEELDGSKKERILHQIKTKTGITEHKCHETCIKQWIKMCIKNDKSPSCPICPNVNILDPPNRQFVSQYEKDTVELYERIRPNCPHLFGIMVCIDNHYVIRYMNEHLLLNENSTLNDLKQSVLSKNAQIYANTGNLVPSKLMFHLNPYNWKDWKYPKIKVKDTHFGIPPFTDKIRLFREELDNESTLAEMWVRYQMLAKQMYYSTTEMDPNIKKALSDVCIKKTVRYYGPTGPDDPGYTEYAYVNPQNPYNLVAHGANCATYNPISWITVHLAYDYE